MQYFILLIDLNVIWFRHWQGSKFSSRSSTFHAVIVDGELMTTTLLLNIYDNELTTFPTTKEKVSIFIRAR